MGEYLKRNGRLLLAAVVIVLFCAALPELFDRPAAGAFLVFLLLYPPCVSALAVMRRELSDRRLLWFGIAWQCVVAYLCALAARLLLSVGT